MVGDNARVNHYCLNVPFLDQMVNSWKKSKESCSLLEDGAMGSMLVNSVRSLLRGAELDVRANTGHGAIDAARSEPPIALVGPQKDPIVGVYHRLKAVIMAPTQMVLDYRKAYG